MLAPLGKIEIWGKQIVLFLSFFFSGKISNSCLLCHLLMVTPWTNSSLENYPRINLQVFLFYALYQLFARQLHPCQNIQFPWGNSSDNSFSRTIGLPLAPLNVKCKTAQFLLIKLYKTMITTFHFQIIISFFSACQKSFLVNKAT